MIFFFFLHNNIGKVLENIWRILSGLSPQLPYTLGWRHLLTAGGASGWSTEDVRHKNYTVETAVFHPQYEQNDNEAPRLLFFSWWCYDTTTNKTRAVRDWIPLLRLNEKFLDPEQHQKLITTKMQHAPPPIISASDLADKQNTVLAT